MLAGAQSKVDFGGLSADFAGGDHGLVGAAGERVELQPVVAFANSLLSGKLCRAVAAVWSLR